MTQPSIFPGGAGGAPLPPDYGYDDGDEGNDRRRLMILGGIAGGVVLLVLAYLLLHGGGSSNDESGVVPAATLHPPVATSPSATTPGPAGGGGSAKPHSSPGTKLPRKSHTRLARDPFKPLFGAAGGAAGAGAATATGAPVSTTVVSPGPTSSTGTVVVPTAPTEGGTPTAGPVTHGDPIWVELISTNSVSSAVFDVGYQDHKFRRFTVDAPTPGSTQGTIFDNEFSLLSIQGNEITLQVGDDTPFDLRKGISHQLV